MGLEVFVLSQKVEAKGRIFLDQLQNEGSEDLLPKLIKAACRSSPAPRRYAGAPGFLPGRAGVWEF
jgi:hypothetical protein